MIKKSMLLLILSYSMGMVNSSRAFAQKSDTSIMLKKRIWLRMNLEEKQNKPFREITKLIIEGVDQGLLTPYENDSLKVAMTKETFRKNLKRPEKGGGLSEEKAWYSTKVNDTEWGDSTQASVASEEQTVTYFQPHEVSVIEFEEHWTFVQIESKLVRYIKSITLIIPGRKFETGLFKVIGTFKYKDLAAYFDRMPQKAVWVNPKNSAENRKLTEAFALGLFSASIVKVENPDDDYLEQIYINDPQKSMMASQWIEEQLIEEESNFWED